MAVIAAAQTMRGLPLEGEDLIKFGSMVMMVVQPPPVDSFKPRAELATVLGVAEGYPRCAWVYHRGYIKPTSNLRAAVLTPREITWARGAFEDELEEPILRPPVADAKHHDPRANEQPLGAVPEQGLARAFWLCAACRGAKRRHTKVQGEPPIRPGGLMPERQEPEPPVERPTPEE